MAFEISVNLEYMFKEAGEKLEDRVAAAAAAGFRKAEMFLTKDRDVASLAGALRDNGVELISTVADYMTQLVDPETHAGYADTFRKAAEDACALGCRNVVVTSGRAVPWLKRDVQLGILADAVAGVVPIAEELDVTILLESANTRVDHPGVLFGMTQDSVDVIQRVASPHVRLLYDFYHSITEGENPAEVLPPLMGMVEHVQIADAPGRGEPGSGAIDWPSQIALLAGLGYKGVIGVEAYPTQEPTSSALAYIRSICD